MQSIDLLSYNLKAHIAYSELAELVRTHTVDILCLQECDSDTLSRSIARLTVAAQTTTGTFGLAIYCDTTRFAIIHSASIPLCTSIYEQLHVQDRERLLVAELFDSVTQQPLFVASFHATHLIATNQFRRKQFTAALNVLNILSHEHPVVLAGDFNYPFFHKRIRQTASDSNFTLTIPDTPTFYGRKFSALLDMTATSRLLATVTVLPFGLSDHAPLLIRLSPDVS